MNKHRPIAVMAAALVGLFCAAATAGEPLATATVNITITVLPYAEVQLDHATLQVTIAQNSITYGPVYVGGTVTCNCAVLLYAGINPPTGAPGTWTAGARADTITPGVHYYNDLLSVAVKNIDSGYQGGTFNLTVTGNSTAKGAPLPDLGSNVLMLTVVPQ